MNDLPRLNKKWKKKNLFSLPLVKFYSWEKSWLEDADGINFPLPLMHFYVQKDISFQIKKKSLQNAKLSKDWASLILSHNGHFF